MSEVVVRVERHIDHSLLTVDGKWCGKVSDYGDENSATVTNVIENLIDKLQISNVRVEEVTRVSQ